MKCRRNITGRKIWVDDDNLYLTRPASADIVLYRDEEIYKTVTVNSDGSGEYRFPCLIVRKNATEEYIYRVDETAVPSGYTKTIQGYNIINTLIDITVNGSVTWDDNNNVAGFRPAGVNVRLLQNGVEIDSLVVNSPITPAVTVNFSFGVLPFADPQGVPYVYTITEDAVANYVTIINGFHITNTYR